MITLQRDAVGWLVFHVEITRQALHSAVPAPDGACPR
jgi:hypothetical protein